MKNSLSTSLSTEQFVHFANSAYDYKVNHLPEGWQVLASLGGRYANQADPYGFKSLAYVNHATKEVVIACGGTNPSISSISDVIDTLRDVHDDAQLFLGKLPSQLLHSGVPFLQEVLTNLPEAEMYHYHFTGHSLGAVLAGLLMVQAQMEGLSASAVTFDDPGCAPLATILTGQWEAITLDETSLIKAYNAHPNFINTTNPHLGEVHCVVLPSNTHFITKAGYQALKFAAFPFAVASQVGNRMVECLDQAHSFLSPSKDSLLSKLSAGFSYMVQTVEYAVGALALAPAVLSQVPTMLAQGNLTLEQHALTAFITELNPENGHFNQTIEMANWPTRYDMLSGRGLHFDLKSAAEWECIEEEVAPMVEMPMPEVDLHCAEGG